MCQSEATPSLALYWHIGETTMRFAKIQIRKPQRRKQGACHDDQIARRRDLGSKQELD